MGGGGPRREGGGAWSRLKGQCGRSVCVCGGEGGVKEVGLEFLFSRSHMHAHTSLHSHVNIRLYVFKTP